MRESPFPRAPGRRSRTRREAPEAPPTSRTGEAAAEGGPSPHLLLGARGERLAADFLARRGFRVIGTGFLARRGEIDLVCRRGDRLVMVEVKTRSSDAFGAPAEVIGPRKRRALLAAAAEYRALAGWRGPIDFAVVAIRQGAEPELIEEPF